MRRPHLVSLIAVCAGLTGCSIQELQRLKEQGVITDEEFTARRQAILNEI